MTLLAAITDLPHQEVLMVITLIMSTISMTLASLALLPHLKPGAALVRDAVLWGALVVVFLSLVGIGWRYWSERGPVGPPNPSVSGDGVSQPPPAPAPSVAHVGY